ncbi:MAG: response regulator [Thermoguttaceae bacterium]|jgi:CheY-like chemotaxis protein
MNTILLIEDNANNFSLLEDIFLFDDIPARLVSVETGEEALNRAIQLQPVLILMDLRLPGIDGLETTQILKRDWRTKDIPVWAITAYAMNGDEERARAAGCCEYITKPVRLLDLANRLRTFLDRLKQREAETWTSQKC